MAAHTLSTLLDNLTFPECPRWHDGRLWFSDMHDRKVWPSTEEGQAEVIVETPDMPAGLGWLPDGRLLVVSMIDRKLLRLDPGGLVEDADLSDAGALPLQRHGRRRPGPGLRRQLRLRPRRRRRADQHHAGVRRARRRCVGRRRAAAFPNGSVITDGGHTLIVAESFGQRLSAYAISPTARSATAGSGPTCAPTSPTASASTPTARIWVADPVNGGVMRVIEGAGPVDWISTGRGAFACVLGGSDGRTLYICTADSSDPAKTVGLRTGRIEATRVDVPAAT